MLDKSNGYEAIAARFIKVRRPTIGCGIVRDWSRDLAPGASILDIGCGHGVPISETLVNDGFAVWGIDASPAMIAAFRERFPNVPVECSAVEDSAFFEREFDAVIAWGLLFLLGADTQRIVIGKVAHALRQGGRFLFTSPRESCSWQDGMTGLSCLSLGYDAYEQALTAAGLVLVGSARDEGDNDYYFVKKP